MAEQEELEFPPLVPEGDEEPAAGDADFIAKCWELAHSYPDFEDVRFGEPLLTRSEKWGLIWRVDYEHTDPKHNFPPAIHRMKCHQNGEQWSIHYAIAQNILPLPTSAPVD